MKNERLIVEIYLHGNFLKVHSKAVNTDYINESYEKNNVNDFFKDLNKIFDNELGHLDEKYLINIEHVEDEKDIWKISKFRFYYGVKYG